MDNLIYAVGYAVFFNVFAAIILGLCISWCKEKKKEKFGVPLEKPKLEDCGESVWMMTSFLQDSLKDDDERWYGECRNAGCSGSNVLAHSSDLRNLVMDAHLVGARIVLRKQADKDIETPEHTRETLSKILTELDVRRAGIVELRYR